jgi:CHAT domain-containing protein/tetratricopeptide (TPR) repeat protein
LGFAYQKLNQTERAIQSLEQALTIEREVKDQKAEASTLDSLGFVYWMTDQFEKAIGWYEQALVIQRELKDRAGEATTLERLGFAYQKLNQTERAIQTYEAALAIERELKDQPSEARTLDSLALAYGAVMKLDKVVEQHERALAIRRELKDRAGEAKTLHELGIGYWNVHQKQRAIQAYEQALTVERELKDQNSEADTLESFALFYSSDDNEKAISCYQRAAVLRHQLKDRAGEAKILGRLGDMYREEKQTERAVESYRQELAILRELQDRSGQATALHDLGYAYGQAEQYDQAIPAYEEELVVRRELKDRPMEASTLFWLGSAYRDLKQYGKARECHEEELKLRRELKDRAGEASALHWLGFVDDDEKEYEKAIAYHEQELAILRELNDRKGEAAALRAMGGSAQNLTQYERALGWYEQALAIDREQKDREQEGRTLNLIGVMHIPLGHFDKELEAYQQALAIARETKNRTNQSMALFALGGTYFRLGRHEEGIKDLEQALAIGREDKIRIVERSALAMLAVGYMFDPAQRDKAVRCLDQALALAREARDRRDEGRVLFLLGLAYWRMNRLDKADATLQASLAIVREQKDRTYEAALLKLGGNILALAGRYDIATIALEQALTVAKQVKIREFEAPILSDMMVAWASRKQPHLAIVLGKEAVNILQQLRGSMRSLDPILQLSFVHANEPTYRYLANLLAEQGRLAEAQQVLELLKEDEFSSFVQRDKTMSAGQGSATLSAQESEWEGRYSEIADQLTSLGLRRGTLMAKTPRTPAEDSELTKLETDLEVGNRAFQSFLDQMETAFRSGTAEREEVTLVREAQGLMETLRDLGHGTVAVYTIFGEQGVRTILITADVQKGYLFKIPAAELNKKILAFREAVRSPTSDPRPLAKELYDILVKPMEKDLEGVQAQTIMWSLDGALRYVPVAALYDGQHFLVERFQNVIFTPASQSRIKDPVSRDWRGLGLGVSLAHEGFQALPNVPSELRAIIHDGAEAPRGVLPGTVKLDADFTKEQLRVELRRHYSIVHLASHFDFVPGTDKNSFLLLGDGSKLTMEEFRNMPQVLQGVELLTLSACDTAVGGEGADGKEVEGFAVLAQRQGAKAVVATLWAVADESTAVLMREFYRLRMSDRTTTKAEALRQAQLALLTGKLKPSTAQSVSDRSVVPKAPQNARKPPTDWSHPYFWAPFTLIGNWK